MRNSKETEAFVAQIQAAESVEEVLEVLAEIMFSSTQQECGVRGGFNVCVKTVRAAAAARLSLEKR